MAQHERAEGKSRQNVFDLIDEKFRETGEEGIAEPRKGAKAKAEEQRRKDALLSQMYPGWKRADKQKAKKATQTTSSERRKSMQASVETDTEESPGTNKVHAHAKKANTVPRKEGNLPSPAPEPVKEPLPSLAKREGEYSYAPPLKFARDQVVTSTLCLRSPRPVSISRQNARHSKKGVAVWYGDEVHFVEADPDDSHRVLPPRRPHRRTF